MKKLIAIICVFCSCLLLCGCTPFDNTKTKDENKEKIEQKEDIVGEIPGEKLILEENTPEWWINLFTFNNVTILLKNNLTIKKGDEYKCIDGKWYCKYQGTETYESHNGRYIYDIYLTKYSIFSFDEDNSCYKAENVSLDESGYLRNIYIYVNEGKITKIEDTAILNSSYIISTLDFYDYNKTSLE